MKELLPELQNETRTMTVKDQYIIDKVKPYKNSQIVIIRKSLLLYIKIQE